MADAPYKIVKDYGVVADHGKNMIKLQLISWNNNPPKLDLRLWTRTIDQNGKENWYSINGLTMSKQELVYLNKMIEEQLTPNCSTHKTERPIKQPENKTLVNICKAIEKKSAVESAVEKNEVSKDTKKTYKNAYEKFKDQFSTYRKSQPDNRQKGYELTHNLILDHIKTICETSDEYNKNALQEWKNSGNMMRFCQDKAFENADALMNVATREEATELMFQWVDEYIGNTSDQSKSKSKCGRKKKGA